VGSVNLNASAHPLDAPLDLVAFGTRLKGALHTSEFEETHWPASHGGRRRAAGDDANSFLAYPGRLGSTDANSSPDPNDVNQHRGIYLQLVRHGESFVNFSNGFEFAQVYANCGTEPTGIRNHVDVPMEKVVRGAPKACRARGPKVAGRP
jgi:hypothetical protein